MKLVFAAAAGGLAATALAACAPTTGPYTASAPRAAADASAVAGAGDQCFRLSQIRNHRIADRDTLYLEVQGRGVYRVEMSGACLAAASRDDPIITRSVGGGGMICRPIDLDLQVRIGHMVTPCIVSAIQPLSPQEAAALPPELRP